MVNAAMRNSKDFFMSLNFKFDLAQSYPHQFQIAILFNLKALYQTIFFAKKQFTSQLTK
jgi:hypothetical protein